MNNDYNNKLIELNNYIINILSKDEYISKKSCNQIFYYDNLIQKCKKIKLDKNQKKIIKKYYRFDKLVKIHNNKYIKNHLIIEKDYLDNILKDVSPEICLDKNQREIVLNDEDYCLVIAGAGAGKTTTIAAKVKYLVEKKNIIPQEILIISFTNKAVDELKDKLNKNLNIPCPISTFHSIGFNILNTKLKNKINIVESSKIFDIISNYINNNILNDNNYKNSLKTLFPSYIDILEDEKISFDRLFFLICRFISNFKTNGYLENYFDELIKLTRNERNKLFLQICKSCYIKYQNYLYKNNMIDFEDMINESAKILTNNNINLKYKYIIVDEYQDISKQRFNLINNLHKLCNAKIIAVGDDWQSIYAFSGSDINLFTDFTKMVGYAKQLKILNTYRNSQEIIDIAGNFIQKNKFQITKKLKSNKTIKNPIIIYTFNNKKSNYDLEFSKTLQKILEQIIKYNEYENKSYYSSILLLGRFNHDLKNLLNTKLFKYENTKIICKKYPLLNITFMTAHASKGLGYDNVIIINSKNEKYGFPSKIEDDVILSYVIKKDISIDYAEERRLFYVAMTRTKNRVYFITPEDNPSAFLIEIKNNYSNVKLIGKWNTKSIKKIIKSYKCPKCGYDMQYRYSTKYKIHLFICTNDTNICGFITNNIKIKKLSIIKCDKCKTGYLIIKKTMFNNYILGCTNYNKGCRRIMTPTEYSTIKSE